MIVGIGVDVVEVSRIRETLEKQGDRFLRRIYTDVEKAYCNARRDPVPHYAVRFAAKEAALKALGTGWSRGIRWQDVEVRREEGKAPTIVLYGEAEKVCNSLGASSIQVTLSHSRDSAVAVVTLEKVEI
jgi:holo-[acyl-carrier protein] synthase